MIEILLESTQPAVLLAVAGVFLVVFLAVSSCVYNVFFHPLRKFPGPKIAAIGGYYEFFYDVLQDGMYAWEVEKMHQKYGPIVRVNANELHINDPDYYTTVYAGGKQRVNKYLPAVGPYTMHQSHLATIDHDLHRKRRAVVSPYFSKRSIRAVEPVLHSYIDRILARFDEFRVSGDPVSLDRAFTALTADIITHYFYGTSQDYIFRAKDFNFALRDAMQGLIRNYHFIRFFPALFHAAFRLPLAVVRRLNAPLASIIQWEKDLRVDMAERIKREEANGRSDEKESVSTRSSVIFNALKDILQDPSLPTEERKVDRLVDEGIMLIFAGAETTARTLSIITFHLLNNQALLTRLREELETLAPGPAEEYTVAQLEALPYLTGVVQEGIRHFHGAAVRIPRCAVDTALVFNEWVIPKGTPVSLSMPMIHYNPTIFPNPRGFDPERWIRAAEKGENLSKYLVSFTKGSRQCLGINLAYAELYVTVARLVRRFDMELQGNTESDVQPYQMRLTPAPKNGSKEVTVKFYKRAVDV